MVQAKGSNFLSRFLTAWIFAAMHIDIGINYFAPGITQFIIENYLDCHWSVSLWIFMAAIVPSISAYNAKL